MPISIRGRKTNFAPISESIKIDPSSVYVCRGYPPQSDPCLCMSAFVQSMLESLLLYRRVWLVNQDISPYKQRFVQYDVLCLYTGMSLCTGHPVQTEKYLFCLALHNPRSTGAYNYNPRSLLTCNLPHSLSVLLPPLQVSQVKCLSFCRSDYMAFQGLPAHPSTQLLDFVTTPGHRTNCHKIKYVTESDKAALPKYDIGNR